VFLCFKEKYLPSKDLQGEKSKDSVILYLCKAFSNCFLGGKYAFYERVSTSGIVRKQ
jgi:hypothetical protein